MGRLEVNMRGISEEYEKNMRRIWDELVRNMRRTWEEYVMFIINDLTSETSNILYKTLGSYKYILYI